ncbi:hypothetical protein [Imtechella halotolerans]|uniref:hypothetical protein n=1 Tax=Imtechella halotolerans TaxID=1165090 RepID=UPI00058BF37A|nr:hypothetical protein [Imtechella halotolerans]WMQ64248.1 hypothetical protein PT603_04545 [Imtechella halotolerans]
MKLFSSIVKGQVNHFQKWDILLFMILTILSVINGQTTVFYLIYFFWWNEFIRLVVDKLWYKKKMSVVNEAGHLTDFSTSLFLMGIYWVFIVVFFGFMAGSKNAEIMKVNMMVLFFHNWFFNLNLIFLVLQRIYQHKTQQQLNVYFSAFNPNTIVIHISIILGGISMFFIVKSNPKIFTPENPWGSVLIILPFLMLRMGLHYLTTSGSTNNKHISP